MATPTKINRTHIAVLIVGMFFGAALVSIPLNNKMKSLRLSKKYIELKTRLLLKELNSRESLRSDEKVSPYLKELNEYFDSNKKAPSNKK